MIGPGDQWLGLCEVGFHNSVIPGLVAPDLMVLLVTQIDIPQNVFAYWTTQTDACRI